MHTRDGRQSEGNPGKVGRYSLEQHKDDIWSPVGVGGLPRGAVKGASQLFRTSIHRAHGVTTVLGGGLYRPCSTGADRRNCLISVPEMVSSTRESDRHRVAPAFALWKSSCLMCVSCRGVQISRVWNCTAAVCILLACRVLGREFYTCQQADLALRIELLSGTLVAIRLNTINGGVIVCRIDHD